MPSFFEKIPLKTPHQTSPTLAEKLNEFEKSNPTVQALRQLEEKVETEISTEFRELVGAITNWDIKALEDLLQQTQETLQAQAKVTKFLRKKSSHYFLEIDRKCDELSVLQANMEKGNYINEHYFFLLQLLKAELKGTFTAKLLTAARNGKELSAAAENLRQATLQNLQTKANQDGRPKSLSLADLEKLVQPTPAAKEISETAFLGSLLTFEFEEQGLEIAELENPDPVRKIELKQQAIKTYLKKIIQTFSSAGSNLDQSEQIAAALRRTAAGVVGSSLLSAADFQNTIFELEQELDSSQAFLLQTALDHKAAESISFDTPEELEQKLRNDFQKYEEGAREALLALRNNPAGHSLRKYGDLKSLVLYAGDKFLLGMVLVNLALAKFNPLELMKNPILWGSVLAAYVGIKSYQPDSVNKPAVSRAQTQETLSQNLENLEPNSPVLSWLEAINLTDLEAAGLKTALADEKRETFSTAALKEALTWTDPERVWPDTFEPTLAISAGSQEAYLLFQILKTCQAQKIQPTKILA